MKMKIALAALSISLSVPHLAAASSRTQQLKSNDELVLQCGRKMNVRQSIVIKNAPSGSWKPLIAEAFLRGVDPTTGMITGVEYIMEGSHEQDEQGQFMAFNDIKRPQFQLLVEVPGEGKKTVKAIFMEVTSNGSAKQTKLTCTRE